MPVHTNRTVTSLRHHTNNTAAAAAGEPRSAGHSPHSESTGRILHSSQSVGSGDDSSQLAFRHPTASSSSTNLRAARMNSSSAGKMIELDDMSSPLPSDTHSLLARDVHSIGPRDVLPVRSNSGGLLSASSLLSQQSDDPRLSGSTSSHSLGAGGGGGATGGQRIDWNAFDQGMRFGCMLMLLAWVMWDTIVDARLRPADQDLWVQLILPVYRGMGCLLLLGWCVGFSLYMWEKYHINYPFLFEVDTRHFLQASEMLDSSCNATILFLSNFLAYFKIMRGDFPPLVPAGYFPMGLLAWMVYRVLPWQQWLFNRPSKAQAIWTALSQVGLAPFGKVTFLTGYLGDIWTSMVKVSVDLAYSGCLLASMDWTVDIETLVPASSSVTGVSGVSGSSLVMGAGGGGGSDVLSVKLDTCFNSPFFKRALIPLLSALPLWLRFMQCLKRYVNTRKRWPHIGNACKYALAHSVILFGVYNASTLQTTSAQSNTMKAAWILCMVLSTIYTFVWDVTMDWGLGNWKHQGLREELMFGDGKKWVYYLAIIVDLFARFAWTLTLIPQGEDSPFSPDFILYLQPSLAAGEILRRTMWGMFRLEWEHLSTQTYHRVATSSVDPSSSAAQPAAEMSGYKVIMEVSVLVVIVLCIGTTAALTAN